MTTIGDNDRYIPFLSTTSAITSIYHGCLLLVHTTRLLPVYTTSVCYWWLISVMMTGIYHSCLLPAHITSGHYWSILLCLLLVTTINDYYQYILPTALYTTSIYYIYYRYTGIYYRYLLMVNTTGSHYQYIVWVFITGK